MKMFTCKNFPTVLLPVQSEIVNARVIINAGSANEEPDSHGVAHFLEHMFFKGTLKRGYKEINQITSSLGSINAYTSRVRTVYHFSFLKKDFDEALEVLLEMVFQPAFPEDEFKIEVGAIVEEAQRIKDEPYSFFTYEQMERVLDRPFGHSIIGTIEEIKAMQLEKLHRFKNRHYNPGNTVISIAGDVSQDQVEKALLKALPELDSNPSKREPAVFDLNDYEFNHASKQAAIGVVVPSMTARAEIEADYMPDIFYNALGGGMHSLLFDRIREELGLCYFIAAYNRTNEQHGIGYITCLLDESNIEQARDEIFKILRKIRSEGLPPELLEVSKRNDLFEHAKSIETSGGFNRQVDAFFTLDGFPLDKYLSFEERVKAVDRITNDQIIEFANQLYGDEDKIKFTQMTQGFPGWEKGLK
jgi:predicted Zn-dependent peptidase